MSAEIKKIVIVALSIIVIFGILLAIFLIPRNRKYDEDEVKAAAKELIEASVKLNEIYYGEGIRYLESSANNISLYCEADPTHLAELGFTTINELKTMTKAVFSTTHSESMFSGIISGASTSSKMARYYQVNDDNRTDPKPLYIMVHKEYKPLMNGEVTYNFDTLNITGSKGEYVNGTIEVTVALDGKSQTQTLKISLIEEESGWRLASTTFANYNELQDKYNDLQNN